MKRFFAAFALLALTLTAPASAKEFVSISVCGTNGCHTTRDPATLDTAMNVTPQASPDRTGPFYKLRIGIGEPGMKDPAVFRSDWVPSLGLLHANDGPYGAWTLPQPQTASALRELSHGLRPFGSLRVKVPTARVAEVVPAPKAAKDDDSHGGGAWKLSLLAILPAGLVFAMRRRGRWN